MQKAFIACLIATLSYMGNAHAEITDEYEDTGSATGFFISPDGLIATCYHVVKEAELIQVEYKNKSYKAHTITANEGNDLAIIKIEGDFPFFDLVGSEAVKLGDDVYTVGYPLSRDLGVEPKLTTGTVSALSGLKDDPTFFQISVPIHHGNSGGPLITTNGLVAGVISKTFNYKYAITERDTLPQNVNYAVKSEYLKILLGIANKKIERNSDPQAENKSKSISKEESVQRVLRILLKQKKHQKALSNIVTNTTRRSNDSPQVWEETLNVATERESLIKALQKIDPDDPFDNYDKYKNELPLKFREWMDSWYQNTYAAWLSRGGGLFPGNIKGNPTPYEEEFKRLKNELSHESLEVIRGYIDTLGYTKLIRSKIIAKGYGLLIERYPDDFKELVFNQEQRTMVNDLIVKSRKEVLSGSSFPSAEIIFHDTIGLAHTDPTISDNNLLLVKPYKQLNDPVDKNQTENTYLYVSLVTKDPYLIKIPASYLGGEVMIQK